MKPRKRELAGHLCGLILLLLFSGCNNRRDTGVVTSVPRTSKCSQLIAKIGAGKYTTYRSKRFWTEDAVRVREIGELAEMKEAYPWLIRAMNHKDKNVAETARELFVASGTVGAIVPESLLEWYDVPDNELIWKGFMWEPRYGYIPKDTEAGQREIAPRCRSLMARIDRGEYTTFHPEPGRRPGLRIIREMQEVFLWKEAYPWLVEATGSANEEVRNTAVYYFDLASLPGARTPERLRIWYKVPDTELERTGAIWEPRCGRIVEDAGGLWYVRASGERISLVKGHGFVKVSEAGYIQYAYPDVGGSESVLCVVECSSDGKIFQSRVIKAGSVD